jgi:YVTN family beta-propeller protein
MRRPRPRGWLLVGVLLALVVGVPTIAAGAFVATGASAARPTRIYVSNYLDDTVSVIDGGDKRVVATIRVGRAPAGMVVSRDQRFVYIADSESNTVSVLDSASNRIAGTIALPRGSEPVGLALSPDGRELYTADGGSDRISVVNTRTGRVVASARVGRQPLSVAVSPDGSTLYTANSGSGNLSVVNSRTMRVLRAIPTGRFPSGVAVTPDGRSVNVSNELSGVTVINAATGTVEARLAAPSPFGMAIGPDGKRAYIADLGPGNVTGIDTRTHRVSATVSVGPPGTDPFGVQATNDAIYVVNQGANTLSVIDPNTLHVVATVSTGNSPYGIAVVQAARWPLSMRRGRPHNAHDNDVAAAAERPVDRAEIGVSG